MSTLSAISAKLNGLMMMKWIGTITGVAGAVMVALNLDNSGYGFILFLISTLFWGGAAFIEKDKALIVLQGNLLVINLIGVYRWLII